MNSLLEAAYVIMYEVRAPSTRTLKSKKSSFKSARPQPPQKLPYIRVLRTTYEHAPATCQSEILRGKAIHT